MITIIHTKAKIMELVNMETSYLSNPVGKIEEIVAMRLPDLIPITDDDKTVFNRLVNMAAKEIAAQMAPYTKGIKIPFIVTYPDDPYPEKDSVVYSFNLYDDQRAEIVVPIIEDNIRTALVSFVTKEWLKLRGHLDIYAIYQAQWPDILQQVKSAMEAGHQAKRTYRVIH